MGTDTTALTIVFFFRQNQGNHIRVHLSFKHGLNIAQNTLLLICVRTRWYSRHYDTMLLDMTAARGPKLCIGQGSAARVDFKAASVEGVSLQVGRCRSWLWCFAWGLRRKEVDYERKISRLCLSSPWPLTTRGISVYQTWVTRLAPKIAGDCASRHNFATTASKSALVCHLRHVVDT
jgi:hypothetical protein